MKVRSRSGKKQAHCSHSGNIFHLRYTRDNIGNKKSPQIPSSDPSQVKHLMPIKITVGAEEIEDGINKECQVDCGAYVLNRI